MHRSRRLQVAICSSVRSKLAVTMGNPATPSKACKPCRVKRRKVCLECSANVPHFYTRNCGNPIPTNMLQCDLKEPSCSQCIRAKVDCTGYRDAFSLKLRDQTAQFRPGARSKSDSPKVNHSRPKPVHPIHAFHLDASVESPRPQGPA